MPGQRYNAGPAWIQHWEVFTVAGLIEAAQHTYKWYTPQTRLCKWAEITSYVIYRRLMMPSQKCRAKSKCSICLVIKWADTAFWLWEQGGSGSSKIVKSLLERDGHLSDLICNTLKIVKSERWKIMMYKWWCKGGLVAWWVIESVFFHSSDKDSGHA